MNSVIAGPGVRHVFVRDLVLRASIGVYPHERTASQAVRINLDLGVADDGPAVGAESLGRVVSYERLATAARRIVAAGHVYLVETLAELLAEACLADTRVLLVRVRVEKLEVFADAASAGVEIERRPPSCPPTTIDSE